MSSETKETLNFEDLEKSFNDNMEDLRKSLGVKEVEDEKPKVKLEKASDSKKDFDDNAEESDEEEEEEEEEDDGKKDMSYKKSMPTIEEQLAGDEQAEAAMDVSPFLHQLVKALDKRFEAIQKSIGVVHTLSKSIGHAQLSVMELSKSSTDTVNRIAQEDRQVVGLKRLQKSRFESENGAIEVTGNEVLIKSQTWLSEKKINLLEAGQLENRVNKGILGKVDDSLDRKVAELMKEAK
jgi:hypothetical protein